VEVVMANILAGTLIDLAPQLCGYLRPGGHLVLAGILNQQVHEVHAAFFPLIDLAVFAERDGWSALAGRLEARA
jgi:ribosomal protein L11 methyltransferase